jgi:hypothetical protein
MESSKAIRRFIIWMFAAIGMLTLYHSAPDGPFSGLAIAGFALISGPILLLAAVDVGRALRQERSNSVIVVAAQIPEFLLGLLAFVAGVGGIALVVWGDIAHYWRIYGAVVSFGMSLYGVSLLHSIGTRWRSAKRMAS